MKNVAVTGAGGFIGTHLINELNAKLNASKDVNIQENRKLKIKIEEIENEIIEIFKN